MRRLGHGDEENPSLAVDLVVKISPNIKTTTTSKILID
jgi:hypothetical protein